MRVGILSHSGMSVYHFRKALILALQERKDEVFVIVPKDDYADKLLNLGFKVVFYDLQRNSLNPFIVLKNFFSLKKVLKSLNLTLIQTSAHKSNTFGIIASFLAKIPYKIALVEGLGSFYVDNNFKTKLVRLNINLLYKIAFKIANKFIFVNSSDAQFMQDLGLKQEKICIIKSVGINLKRFFPYKVDKDEFLKEHNMPKKPIVLMVARVLWHKGIKEFYEAAFALKDKANFILIGGRDDNSSCAPLEFLQNGAVYYLGQKENIEYFLNLSDIFVLPSYKEGFPISVLEAKACAKTCVVSDAQGCVEAISNGYDGLLSRVKDSKDLINKINLLLVDEKLRLNLGSNAFKEAIKFDENEIAKRYLSLYNKVVNV
ncbi:MULTISPECIES: glycosyltransferase family 4 protein [unclassified Campylobacter]|uniref:glycosyltransferase family 4 protein n=1 Tax=unclassified Campylobacter TaxID=2593542 RepID=UPI0012381268|nr:MULTISPECIES: glycosyltransferase family 4 protein [unclassified Campylobacter]KAA6225471.1 glycosyltransferase family 4 protein [Campylobacter sp. LR196d]KAA6227409.1 glycosyltransferase family 4 protein [Campylobacter sp. LR185c]KAA6229742.1 glycosyltransferase family 4 protein [Campylobacter sp. LR286c]KAA6234267.1 glycosyltransferase family 4 protein [Campylobacter sp. LR291e]KAA6234485.1 glycosyltransferase family 4 protein [Campylobacter sp. LR264d]